MDTVYVASNVDLGCLESKCSVNDTKEKVDSRVKMPIIMREMLLEIVVMMPYTMLSKVHIVGYNIDGKCDCTVDHGMLLGILLDL